MSDVLKDGGHVLPYPFCGELGIDVVEGTRFHLIKAVCESCGASTGELRRDIKRHRELPDLAIDDQDWDLAIEAWNERYLQ